MGYIYKITNDINEKVYIGQTSKSRPTDRWSQHKSDSKNIRDKDNSILHNAMHKYGVEHFYFEIIEEVNNYFLDEREIYWIKFYNSKTPNGYNISEGGKVPHGIKSKFKGIPRTDEVRQKLKASWTDEKRLEQSLKMRGENNPMYGKTLSKETKQKIREKLTGENNPFYGKRHDKETKQKLSQYQDHKKKQVLMLDKNTSKVLQKFSSLSEAGRFVKGDDSYISKACRRKTRTGENIAYGYRWEFVESVSTNCSEEISTSRSEEPL